MRRQAGLAGTGRRDTLGRMTRVAGFFAPDHLTVILCLALAPLLAAGCATGPKPLPHAPPEAVGMDGEKLDRAVDLYRRAVEEDELRNAVLLVARDGTVVLHEAVGWRCLEKGSSEKESSGKASSGNGPSGNGPSGGGEPIEPDALFRMASNTKAVVCAAALVLEEEGVLNMDDPVGRWIPAFSEGEFADITVRHLATHTSGLPRSPIFFDDLDEGTTLKREAARFAEKLELENEPGAEYGYSNVGYNVLGGVIEAAAGTTLDDVLRTRLFEPLGMDDTCNHESTADRRRMSDVYRLSDGQWTLRWSPDDEPDYPLVRASGGMISSAADFAVFMQMLLDGGRYGRTRILSEDAARRAVSPLVEAGNSSYGYGWRVDDDGVFRHGGSDGTYAWADPSNSVFVLIFTQSSRGENPRDEFIELVTEAIVDDGDHTQRRAEKAGGGP